MATMSDHGLETGIKDRTGRMIRLGDRLRFDPKEWGDECEFVIEYKNGELVHPGVTSDLSEWCEIIDQQG